jgi:hypothetical protein
VTRTIRLAAKSLALILLALLAACNTVARSEKLVPGAAQLASLPPASNYRGAIAEVRLIPRAGTGLGLRPTLLDFDEMADAVRASLASRGMMGPKGPHRLEIRKPGISYGYAHSRSRATGARILETTRVRTFMSADYRLIRVSSGNFLFDETVETSRDEPATISDAEFDLRGQPTPKLQGAVEAAVRENIVEFLRRLGKK